MCFSRLNQVANKSPNTLETKFLKIFLSAFHDWKVRPRVSRDGSRKNFYITSQLELPLVNKSPNRVARTLKSRILKNFLSLFRNWDFNPPMSCENILCKLVIGGMRLDWPVTKSPEQDNTIFEIFDIFAKKKDFPKTIDFPKIIKTLKNLFVFDQQKLSMWNIFN